MANYASNLLFASTENEKDLEKMAELLRENFFDCNVDWYDAYFAVDFAVSFRIFSNGEWKLMIET